MKNVICFGDSNTYGYDPRSYFGGRYDAQYRWPDILAEITGWNIQNYGENGREIPKCFPSLSGDIDLLIVMLGTNNLLQQMSVEDTAEGMLGFLTALNLKKEKILLVAPPPMVLGEWVRNQEQIHESKALCRHYRSLAKQIGCHFADAGEWGIPITFDGVHFTEEGHRIFAGKIFDYVNNEIFSKKKPIVDCINCISVRNMRESDCYTIAGGVSGLELMKRAAYGIFLSTQWYGRIAVVVGSGNNGGDGFALACILKENGFSCSLFSLSKKYSKDSHFYADKAKNMGIPIHVFQPELIQGFDIIVDCLLGTGFQGPLRETYRIAIETINASSAYVISVDINSGMNGDTGEADLAVKSDLTVTIGYVKIGLISKKAEQYIKHLVCADIGISLLEEEFKICRGDMKLSPRCISCPSWLDMTPIVCTGKKDITHLHRK